jgi:NifU-like protein
VAWEYSEKTKKLFLDAIHGRPGTHLGEIESPDGVGEHGSIVCGDAMRFMFRCEKHPTDPLKDVIVEAKYLTFGCTSAIASSEALCALLEEGRYTPIEALKIRNTDIVRYLEGLPAQKIHCSVMGTEALQAAVFDWARRRGVDLRLLGIDIRPDEEEGRLVCKCFSITEPYLRRKIRELNLRTITDVIHATKAGGGCTSCHYAAGGIQDILDDIWGQKSLRVVPDMAFAPVAGQVSPTGNGRQGSDGAPPPPWVSSPYRFAKQIEKVIEEYVRPFLKEEGGDIDIVDIKDNLIYCRLSGACGGCPGAGQTLRLMVEKKLKEMVDERIKLIQV